MVSLGTQDSTSTLDGRSAVVPTHDTQHQVSPPRDDQQIVSLSMSSVIPSSSEAYGEAATRHRPIFSRRLPHILCQVGIKKIISRRKRA